RDGSLLGNPRHYRDPQTEGVMEKAFERVSRSELYQRTGLQFMRFNTLFQLVAMARDGSPLVDMAHNLLLMPDLLHYFFTGIKVNELTDASTTQMLDPGTCSWSDGLLEAFGLKSNILGSIVKPGTVLGPLRASVASDTGLTPMPIVATATHDTAAAVAAVPARGDGWAYISSGTWSLMGGELSAPCRTEAALAANFTNEIGFGGRIRFLKNIMGLWLVQECRRVWERKGQSYSYEELMRLADEAPAFGSIIDPDHDGFILPTSMPQAIADFCLKTKQKPPEGVGPTVRCALESLALRYRWVLEKLQELTGQKLHRIHIVGGGSQNQLLCQLTADCCGCEVLAGPVEATAIGNVLVQAVGLGVLSSLEEAREVVRNSFELRSYVPRKEGRWQERYDSFCRIIQGDH
ncbi:MAG: rhamnulokinase family protein, partial [Gemmataceae bacterium]